MIEPKKQGTTLHGPPQAAARVQTECFRRFTDDDLVARDRASLDIWPREESLENTDNLLQRGAITAEIVEDLESALEEFRALAESIQGIGIDIEGDE